jgi:hypothetical protein
MPWIRGVVTRPGRMQLTRMWCLCSSQAALRVSPTIPAFEMAYLSTKGTFSIIPAIGSRDPIRCRFIFRASSLESHVPPAKRAVFPGLGAHSKAKRPASQHASKPGTSNENVLPKDIPSTTARKHHFKASCKTPGVGGIESVCWPCARLQCG